jgi:hypothetical protein
MQALYGNEYLRKWAAFSPGEMLDIWLAKFQAERIQAGAIQRLIDTMSWDHPPTLPMVVERLREIGEAMRIEGVQQQMHARLPAPDQVAKADSPVVQECLREMRRFINRHRMPS